MSSKALSFPGQAHRKNANRGTWIFFREYWGILVVFNQQAKFQGTKTSWVKRVKGKGSGNSLQWSCLESPMGRGAWWATTHGIWESDMTNQLTHTYTQVWKVRLIPTDIRRLPSGVIKTREMPRVNRSVIFWTVCSYLLSLDNPTCLYPVEGSEFRLRRLTYWCRMSMLMMTEVNTVVGSILFALLLFSCPVVQLPSRPLTPWTAACQASMSLTISQSLPKFTFIASVMLFIRLILWCPLLLLSSILPSFSGVSNSKYQIKERALKWRESSLFPEKLTRSSSLTWSSRCFPGLFHHFCHRGVRREKLLIKNTFTQPSLLQKKCLYLFFCLSWLKIALLYNYFGKGDLDSIREKICLYYICFLS